MIELDRIDQNKTEKRLLIIDILSSAIVARAFQKNAVTQLKKTY